MKHNVTTVGLRRPRSRSLTYCWVKPDVSAKRSWRKTLLLPQSGKVQSHEAPHVHAQQTGRYNPQLIRFIPYKVYSLIGARYLLADWVHSTMQDLRIARRCISARIGLTGRDQRHEQMPVQGSGASEAAKVTAYDESHTQDYLRLLDAEDRGRRLAHRRCRDFRHRCRNRTANRRRRAREPLARAKWMTGVGYAHLLGAEPPLNR